MTVKVATGWEADAEFIKAEAPDAVILAAGGVRDMPGLAGAAGNLTARKL